MGREKHWSRPFRTVGPVGLSRFVARCPARGQVGALFNRVAGVMNRPRDDEYGSLSDLLGGFEEGDSADSYEDDLPAGLPPEYAEAYRRGYERARRGDEPTVALEEELAAALATRQGGPDAGRPAVDEPGASPVDELDDDEPETGEIDVVPGEIGETGATGATGVGGVAQSDPEAGGPAQGSRRSHAESFGWHEPTRAIPVGESARSARSNPRARRTPRRARSTRASGPTTAARGRSRSSPWPRSRCCWSSARSASVGCSRTTPPRTRPVPPRPAPRPARAAGRRRSPSGTPDLSMP